ncbi:MULTISPECIES: helix-turn-helix domain-containing protein [unclassified Streptomyces]|uniref:helix-turn-helix domain-containing protein n=1 Tax=unclassified Streptomyces TaxID=2593676 RepID=UPI000DAB71A4|nr:MULTISPECIES: helix-turn-helix transcriptional regulator [unclassified Streptomyces]PZT76909.1 transcriptional regulator [Streptomyces sp. AC1-42W]PZT79135.1 transcriptional regulator [Streptomyces sp. AC1-42T]
MKSGKNSRKRVTSWHLIGAQLATFRRAAGLTQSALAERSRVSEDTIASVEQGRRPLQMDLAILLDQILETKGALQVAVAKVPQKERFPAFVQDFVEYEQEAVTLMSYQNQVVPGLLQTEEYARAVFASLCPPIEPEEIDARVADRMGRQALLARKPRPLLSFLLEESILHRPIGGASVLREQIECLRRYADLPILSLQIVPTSRETHAALDGPMVLLETPDHDQLGYIEGQRVSFLVDDPDEVSVLQQKYGMLRSQALSPEESIRLMEHLLGER